MLTSGIEGNPVVYVDSIQGNVCQLREVWKTDLKPRFGTTGLLRTVTWNETPVAGEHTDIEGETFYSKKYTAKFKSIPLLYTYMSDLKFEGGVVVDYAKCNICEDECLRFIDSRKKDDMVGLQLYTFMMEDCDGSLIVHFVMPDSDTTAKLYRESTTRLARVVLEFGEDTCMHGYHLFNISKITYIQSMNVTDGGDLQNPTLDAFAALLERPSVSNIRTFNKKLEKYENAENSEAYTSALETLAVHLEIISSWVPLKTRTKKWQRDWNKSWKKAYKKNKSILGNESFKAFFDLYTTLIDPDISKQIRRGNVCNTVSYIDRTTNNRWKLQYDISALVNAFRIWYVHHSTHVFRLYDYKNYFLTTQELGQMYYELPDKYRKVLVWKYKPKGANYVRYKRIRHSPGEIYVLANGDRLVPGDKYNGIFLRASSKASSRDSSTEKLKKAYNKFQGLELGNIIRLKFLNRRIEAKGSIRRHDMRFIASETANLNKWELCKGLLISFRNDFWNKRHEPVTYDETSNGVVYRYVNDTLFAYKLVNVSGSDSPHAMALMMKSTREECEMGTFNINSADRAEYEAADNRTAAAGALHVHKSTGKGLCVVYTYLCAEIFLLCAELWTDRTGMQTSRVLLHEWLTKSNITRAELDEFDKLAEVSSDSVIARRRNMETFTSDVLRERDYANWSEEFQDKFRGTVAFLQRYTNPDRVPVKRARSPVSSPRKPGAGAKGAEGAELDDYEDAPSLEEVPDAPLRLGGDELQPIEFTDAPVHKRRKPGAGAEGAEGAELDEYAPSLEEVPDAPLRLGGDELKPIEFTDASAKSAADEEGVEYDEDEEEFGGESKNGGGASKSGGGRRKWKVVLRF